MAGAVGAPARLGTSGVHRIRDDHRRRAARQPAIRQLGEYDLARRILDVWIFDSQGDHATRGVVRGRRKHAQSSDCDFAFADRTDWYAADGPRGREIPIGKTHRKLVLNASRFLLSTQDSALSTSFSCPSVSRRPY